MKKILHRPKDGERRDKKVFLLFPKILYNSEYEVEIRWLCWTSIYQTYIEFYSSSDGSEYSGRWCDERWSKE